MSYNIALIIHLFCAVIFVGFIFVDVVLFKVLHKRYGDEKAQEIKQVIYDKGVKIYPLSLLLLILSGGYMFSKYINSTLGYFQTNMQMLLWIKFFLAMVIFFGVLLSLIYKVKGKDSLKYIKKFHVVALILSFLIIFIAKSMFWI